jgi:hypothetical protein
VTLPLRHAQLYLAPLREGGSLPAVIETDDGSLWVVKFRGAGQGPKALVAEIIVNGLARAVGLRTPELSLVEVAADFGQGERDPEIRDVLRFSEGVNVGARYMDGAWNLDPVAVPEAVDADFAAATVWLDALVTNPDRSARNPNLMFWDGESWLIDHGAALFDHHNWARVDEARMRRPFAGVQDHILLPYASSIVEADERLAPMLTPEVVAEVVDRIPDTLLEDSGPGADPASADEQRDRYRSYLQTRLESPRAWVAKAEELRTEALSTAPTRLDARR